MKKLYSELYEAIAKQMCDKCMSSPKWEAVDCTRKNCHHIYEKQTLAAIEIFNKESCSIFKTCLDVFYDFLREKRDDTRLPQEARKYIGFFADNFNKYKDSLIKKYREDFT